MKKIYLDYSATTPVKKEVLEEMMPYFIEEFGNPSSIHKFGRDAKKHINEAREKVAKLIGATGNEMYFTAGGSESDNWALKSAARDLKSKGKGNHIITTKIEHHAILHTCEALEKEGFEITYLDVDKYGLIDLDDLRNQIKDTTILVSIMFINNEIGTIEPIFEIGKITKEKGVLFHTDAVQAVGNVHIDVKKLNIDMLSM
ncbi:MAG: aminotransferase class V-fold PLP-dependent enzyme, partial [Clostridiales bacterium]|nr:aminotransferase class V-fold PLP-dependent enzyme [Clostridiales bacterium]